RPSTSGSNVHPTRSVGAHASHARRISSSGPTAPPRQGGPPPAPRRDGLWSSPSLRARVAALVIGAARHRIVLVPEFDDAEDNQVDVVPAHTSTAVIFHADVDGCVWCCGHDHPGTCLRRSAPSSFAVDPLR